MILGFSGYLVFGESASTQGIFWEHGVQLETDSGLIIGCAYERITKIIPLFVILYVYLSTQTLLTILIMISQRVVMVLCNYLAIWYVFSVRTQLFFQCN